MQNEPFDPAHVPEDWQPTPPAPQPPQSAPWKRFTIIIGLVVFGLFATAWTLNRINMMGRPTPPAVPLGGWWQYEVKDISVRQHESSEMKVYEQHDLERALNHIGGRGYELVAMQRIPDKYNSESSAQFRLIFKKRVEREPYVPEYDPNQFRKAQEAETKAWNERLNRKP